MNRLVTLNSESNPMKLRLLTASLGALLTSATSAQSLLQSHQAALQYDATYQAAKALYESKKFQVEQVYALRRPSVGLEGSLGKTQINGASQSAFSRTMNNAVTTATSTPSTTETESTDKKITLSLQQSIFNKANDYAIQQAELSLQLGSTALQAAEQDLIIRLSQAYFDVLAAKENLSFILAQKAAVTEQLASAKRNFEVGTATITDTKEAQSRYDLILAQEILAESDVLVKSRALDQLTGLQNAQPWPLKNQANLNLILGDENHWVKTARDESSQVATKQMELEIAKLEISKSKSGHFPTVALTGYISRNNPSGQTLTQSSANQSITNGAPSNLFFEDSNTSTPGNNTSKYIGVVVKIPLFAGYSTENRIKETVALQEKARNDLEAVERTVAQATRTAFFGVQSGLSQVKALEAAEASSQSALDANKLGYQVGVRINIDVLNSQSQLFQTKRDLAKARYDVLLGQLKLRQAAGVLKVEDVQALNGIFGR